MNGKKRCTILKEIRQKIADANDIEFITSESQHKGDCLGTCPKCEAELKYLERELEKRQRLGKTVIVAGLSALIATSSVACDDWIGGRETGGEPLPPEGYEQGTDSEKAPIELDGDIAALPDDEMMGEPAWPEGEPEIKGLIALPDEETETAGDPLPPTPDDIVIDIVDMNEDELKSALLYSGITREGLYNSHGWAELFVSTEENGNDIYRSPIEGYETITVMYVREANGVDFVIDVQFHTEDSSVILPEDDLS
jgi:hypothetical protein